MSIPDELARGEERLRQIAAARATIEARAKERHAREQAEHEAFSKLARSVLRHIRVASKQELKERILAAIDDINKRPVVHSWSYKLDQAA